MQKLELFNQLQSEWITSNEEFFGIPSEESSFLKKDILDEYALKYWNTPETRCTLCKILMEGKDNNLSTFVEYNPANPHSGFFIESSINYNIIYGWFRENAKDKAYAVFLLPHIMKHLTWKISRADYIPRGVVERNSSALNKVDNIVRLPNKWKYTCEDHKLEVKKDQKFGAAYLDDLSLKYIKAFCPDFSEDEDDDTFIKHLESLPDTDHKNILNYHFYDYHYFFKKLKPQINRVNPTAKKHCNVNTILVNLGRNATNTKNKSHGKMREEEGDCTLILNAEKSDLYAISNFRSVLYSTQGYSQHFFFEKTELFFDAFKTSTSKTAGKIRTLLDDVYVGEDGLLYKKLPDGRVLNQFEAYKQFFIDNDTSIKTESLSCLSKTLYCNNNDPKRIMMTSKSIGQSIPVENEYDPTTHSVLARVVFGDFYGLTNGDGLVISQSFANRMKSFKEEKVFVSTSNKAHMTIINDTWDFEVNKPKRCMTLDEFLSLTYSKNNFNRCNNIRITDIVQIKRDYGSVKDRNGYDVMITYDIPVKAGDKFTNMHASKGVGSMIVPDYKMPKLIEKCGIMEPGPFDIIISSYGISKRANIGQICEAYSRMKGINKEVPLKELFADADKYSKPLVEFDGEVVEKAFGLQEILRLQHLSISHASFSGIGKVTDHMLNFGEQENLFLLAHGFSDIQKEINQRSPKYHNREGNINSLIINKELIEDEKLAFNMEILGIFHSLGFEVNISDSVDDSGFNSGDIYEEDYESSSEIGGSDEESSGESEE